MARQETKSVPHSALAAEGLTVTLQGRTTPVLLRIELAVGQGEVLGAWSWRMARRTGGGA